MIRKPRSPVGAVRSLVIRSTTASGGGWWASAAANSASAGADPSASTITPRVSLPTNPARPYLPASP